MVDVYLLLGTNLGNREANIEYALDEIEEHVGTIMTSSKIYESKSWGYVSENPFLNHAILIRTKFECKELLELLQEIEISTGRENRGEGYQDREIDIDILFYGNDVINSDDLIIPHPRLHLRKFTLKPLAEIAGNFKHPVFNKTIKKLLQESKDDSIVDIYKGR